MKRFLLFLLLLVGSAASAAAWEIESFDAELAVQGDGSLRVTETMDVDFQGEPRHGIYRDIPLTTQDRLGVKRSIRLSLQEATDESGRPWEVKPSREGAYRRFRLGSSDRTYTGRKSFRIVYRVERILQSFPDHDELYWNATGNAWAVPIHRVTAVVRLPQPVPADQFRSAAYTGAYGSTGRDVLITALSDGGMQYAVTRGLNPFEGLTLVAGWPKGLVPMPTTSRKARWFLQDNWPLAIPLAVLLLMTCLWWNFGRDPDRQTITVQYEPPDGLSPAEAGALADDSVDLRDITATIVDLGRRGFLTIEELNGKEYILTRQGSRAREEKLKPHEELLLACLFASGESVHLSDLENKFYEHLPELRDRLYDGLVRRGCWWGRPDRVRQFWGAAAVSVLVFGTIGALTSIDPGLPFAAAVLSTVMVALFAPFMPRKTWAGARLAEKVAGLQEFLRRTDQDRIQREASPAALFERMLPYAMALGVANQWARAFEGIYQVSPAWYTSYDGRSFTPHDFTRRMGSASERMGSTLASAPRSSGGSGFSGGFSGGGGGGGGGGAW